MASSKSQTHPSNLSICLMHADKMFVHTTIRQNKRYISFSHDLITVQTDWASLLWSISSWDTRVTYFKSLCTSWLQRRRIWSFIFLNNMKPAPMSMFRLWAEISSVSVVVLQFQPFFLSVFVFVCLSKTLSKTLSLCLLPSCVTW